jgi:hypothetical protein
VTAIVADAVKDDEFMQLFKRAITVELSNLAELREKAEALGGLSSLISDAT